MKGFLQNLLIVFSLALCALIAYQWHREAGLRTEQQKLHDQIFTQKEQIQGLEGSVRRLEEEVIRLDGIKNSLTELVKSNRVEIARYRQDLEKADAEIERNLQTISSYKSALEQANENIKRQNEDIKTQNEQLKQLNEERTELVEKYNKVVKEFNDLATQWNAQQQALAGTNAPARK